nr:hypothetical protein [Tanacetum cinerariifolium]
IDIPEADMPPRKRAYLTTPAPEFETGESSVAGIVRQPGPTESDVRRCRVEQAGYGITDTEAMYARKAWVFSMDRSSAIEAHVRTLETQKMAPKKRTTRATPTTTTTPTIIVTNAQLQALINRGVAAALAERDTDRNRNGDSSNDSGTGRRRKITTPQECTYTDFLKCQPMSFQGTEGVIGSALSRWNSHMVAVGQDVAYAMPWAALKKIITSKYCLRGKIQKLESEFWNLKVKGLDLLNYNHRFQELALMCERMFPGEEAKVERYIGGLPDMIHGSVKA